MEQNILVQILALFEGFIQKLSLPADLVKFSVCHDGLLTTQVDEVAILKHLSELVEDIRLCQNKGEANTEKLAVELADPPAKKLKLDGQQNSSSVSSNIMELDDSLIQVKAGKAEIDRRIAAFIQRKRVEVDLLNKREFCSVVDTDNSSEFRCARTDAVFVHRLGQKSHIRVTKVDNTSTTSEAQALGPEISTLSPQLETKSCPGVEERLRNIETHLGYRPVKREGELTAVKCQGLGDVSYALARLKEAERPVPSDVYKRLADLELKVLRLEGLSPEYFTQNQAHTVRYGNNSRNERADFTQGLTLDAIDERIKSLRQSLSKGKCQKDALRDERQSKAPL